jgi:hypothetical protein
MPSAQALPQTLASAHKCVSSSRSLSRETRSTNDDDDELFEDEEDRDVIRPQRSSSTLSLFSFSRWFIVSV